MGRQLQSWEANLDKRLVKAPEVYVRDSSLLQALLGLVRERADLSHPRPAPRGRASRSEEAIERVRPDAAYFWATHTGAEMDLLLMKGGRRYGVEVKSQDAPRVTP